MPSKAYIGRINPLGDGRATWELDRTDERGTARSVQAAQIALAEAFGRWVVSAGLSAPVGDQIIAAKWKWTDGKYKGSTFWACHDPVADGRPDAWIKIGARPLGAAYVYV
ncbi:hypothetical protein JHX88_08770 [Paracoccus saliphilus]|uniref:Uncharacterized protein n=1 Tax=Paracoccus saliphilus TaxID=405559 RepID=A0ABY7SCQ3_9RHOB|nr:hypothetical protein [Paracoccus saliphilus]WCR04786.1 hypothetical protein JHX88_08770 [Paracoccus saliphilus]